MRRKEFFDSPPVCVDLAPHDHVRAFLLKDNVCIVSGIKYRCNVGIVFFIGRDLSIGRQLFRLAFLFHLLHTLDQFETGKVFTLQLIQFTFNVRQDAFNLGKFATTPT